MNRIPNLALLLAALLFLTVAPASRAHAGAPSAKDARPHRLASPSFTLSGVYGGIVQSQMTIDGVSYRVRPDTRAYLLGVGLVPMMSVPIGSRVFVTGVGSTDAGTIWTLIARPANEEQPEGTDMSRFIRVVSGTSPE
jgi:hypothetical protein